MSEVTRILDAIGQGVAQAADQLLPLVYQELRRLAAYKMANEPAGHTLQPTALVNQTILIEASTNLVNWQPTWINTLSTQSLHQFC
jgi:hypothetical protein